MVFFKNKLLLIILLLLFIFITEFIYKSPSLTRNFQIYTHSTTSNLGDDYFGDLIADFKNDYPGRCSHAGPLILEYPNQDIVAFHTNTSDHNTDGWSEYAYSSNSGQSWNKYNKFKISYDAYQKDPKSPLLIEEGLVTEKGKIILFLSEFKNEIRSTVGFVKSNDNGVTWSEFQPVAELFGAYPASATVIGNHNFILFDTARANHEHGPHILMVSDDDGESWHKKSVLTFSDDKWYGALTAMADGSLLAGSYDDKNEFNFYYTISKDLGATWSNEEFSYVDKKIRDPELAYLDGVYYLFGRTGSYGPKSNLFVMYQSVDGMKWDSGTIVSSDSNGPDGYSSNTIINKYNSKKQKELAIQYSIIYDQQDTNEYVFFLKPNLTQ